MKFHKYFNKPVLHIAVEIGNVEIVKLLLARKDINVNIKSILIFLWISFQIIQFFSYNFTKNYFYSITKYLLTAF